MRQALIEGLICHHSDPIKINGIVGAFLLCEYRGAESIAALLALRDAGHVVWNSRTDLASDAPAKLSKHHFTRPGTMWTPAYDDGEPPVEVPQDADSNTFVVVVRDVAIFHAKHHENNQSTLWGRGDLSAWATALGALVLSSGTVHQDDYTGTMEDPVPRQRQDLDLDVEE